MPKKSFSQHPQKKQVSPMSHPRANIVNGAIAAIALHNPLQDDDLDDLDDICPVCESECTCRKKSAPSTTPAPSVSSSISSLPSAPQPTTAGKRPLKIKLTLPPNLKARKPPATHASSTTAGAHLGTAGAGPSSSKTPAHLAAATAPAPKRRGRPPKALAAARKKAAADDMEYRARGTTGTSSRVRQVHQPPAPSARASTADLSDSTLSDYPTFVPAASESTHSSSSESSDSSIDSDSDSDDDDSHHVVRNDTRQANSTKLLPGHLGHTKKRPKSNWETKPRRRSVGPDDGEEQEESSDDSGESSDDSSEDGDDEDDGENDAEADVEADVEAGGLLADADEDLDDESEETHSRIGVSFPGTGYSDDDEESNFDADLFFANLDSDSGDASSPEARYTSLGAFGDEDVELTGSFSADEEDALLLMDIDPSVQLRRGNGEFEIGVDLDSLSFGWDGQLLFSNSGSDGLGLSFGFGAMDEDEEMGSVSGSDTTASWEGSNAGTIVLQESDGDTTEDELVDSDGLPNPRAMMLFKWPSTISGINPLSTVSPSSVRDPPANASTSTRIALASMHRSSPPPASPSPADILSGRVSMDDTEDIEMEKDRKVRRRRGSVVPLMGEFVVPDDVHASRRTAVVGAGCEVPSFYPRPVRIVQPVESAQHDITPSEDMSMSAMRLPLTTESSEDVQEISQSYTSELSSTEAIELDDVLDSSLLDSEPPTEGFETDLPGSQSESSPLKSSASPHLHNLSRWERIPMATFRRTRESAVASGVDGAVSDNGLGVLPYHRNIGAMMGGTSLLTPPRPLGLDKMSRASARKRKGRHSHGSSPTLLPARDGTLGSPFAPASSSGSPFHSSKSKKEIKKEKAMMKRKMVAKASQYRYHQPSRHHHHHPNHKSRATNAVQRAGFSSGASSSIPSLSI